MVVEAVRPRPDRAASVVLQPPTPSDLHSVLPFRADDPTLPWLGLIADQLLDSTGTACREELASPSNCSWAIYHEDSLAGTITLTYPAHFSIWLAEGARGKGIGSLALGGMLKAVSLRGKVHGYNSNFSHNIRKVATEIHTDNKVSRKVCRTAGFTYDRHMIQSRNGVAERWNRYIWLNPRLVRSEPVGAVERGGLERTRRFFASQRVIFSKD